MFTHAAYDDWDSAALLRFKNGDLYRYFMPRNAFEALLASESMGKHYKEHIRGKYRSVKL